MIYIAYLVLSDVFLCRYAHQSLAEHCGKLYFIELSPVIFKPCLEPDIFLVLLRYLCELSVQTNQTPLHIFAKLFHHTR